MSWFAANITFIKDSLWVLFTLIATLIAILTYRRSRQTLLQPLRSEVIKLQIKILIDLLEFVKSEKSDLYINIDYMGIIACNAYKLLKICDFEVGDDKLQAVIEDSIGGFVLLHTTGEIESFIAPTDPFYCAYGEGNDANMSYTKKVKTQITVDRVVDLEVLDLTKRHLETISKLREYKENPLMPKAISELLSNLGRDIDENIKTYLYRDLKQFILRATQMNSDKDHPIQITHQAIYNSFMRDSISHNEIISNISDSIRDYLKIDKKWD